MPSLADWVAIGVAILTVITGVINYVSVRTQRDTVKELTGPTNQALTTIDTSTKAVTTSLSKTTSTIATRLDSLVAATARTEATSNQILAQVRAGG